MKIVCIQSPFFDLLTATVIEGLKALGHEIIASEESNYATKSSDKTVRAAARQADLIIVFSNNEVRTELVHGITDRPIVYVDGADQQEFRVPPDVRFQAIFKRELNRHWINVHKEAIYPLPFAAETRYFLSDAPPTRDINVSFAANLNTNCARYAVHYRLAELNDPQIFIGSTGECAYGGQGAIGAVKGTQKFRELLYRSQISVNVPGVGYDCARYWEILAAGALLYTQELDIVIPNPLVEDEHCVVFRSLDEFIPKLKALQAAPERLAQIAAAGQTHLLKHHTTRARAQYLLDCVLESSQSGAFCDSFYRPDQIRKETVKEKWRRHRKNFKRKYLDQ